MTWWHSVNVRMIVGTSLLLLVVLSSIYAWRYVDTVAARREQLKRDADLTAKLVLRSFEAIEPGKRPVHTGYLARNLVELPDVHNIQVVTADGAVVYTHHAEDVGRRLDPETERPCAACHQGGGKVLTSIERPSRRGDPLFHHGFTIPNAKSCQRCHDPRYETLGMMLTSFELKRFYHDLDHWRTSLAGSGLAALLVSIAAIALLFSRLVRRPLTRLERQIRAVERGDFEDVASSEEVGEIAVVHRAFSSMARQLAEAQAALEERVRDGSAQIDSLSEELELVYSNLIHLEHLTALGTLSAQMAHEIRTPLNAMALHLQLLERGLDRADGVDPSLLELTSDVGGEVQRIVEVLDQLMQRARRPEDQDQREALGKVADSVVFLMSAEARRAGVALHARVAEALRDEPVHANHLRQILTNLVSNAVRATPFDGRVLILADPTEGGRVQVSVIDSGPGVADEDRERIFEPFFTTHAEGTGLGLSIIHRIVDDCGGRIEVTRSEFGGAAFTVTLGGCCQIKEGT
jgi:two-component system, NtrC family, sensor kinase